MNKETYDKATGLVQSIKYTEINIQEIELMLERYDDSHTMIKVECRTGRDSIPMSFDGQHVLPELREALQKALKRFRQELQEAKEELEAL